jgi:UDP-N-acetylmuramoylalanine--D-glutamate ligase
VAITGTNGKTTVTSLVAAMLAQSGVKVRAAGNIGYPLVEAVNEPGLDLVVAEVSSFQLALTTTFHPVVAAWLNLAEDHLDWHPDLADYAAAKARIWARQLASDVTVANAEDAAVMEHARRSAGRLVTFGLERGDFHLAGDELVGPSGPAGPAGGVWASVADLARAMPHDRANALAALAIASAAGASPAACLAALRSQQLLPHRVELVASVAGTEYYDDSKATTPSAVVAALAGFRSVVLVAGGRNKGLDLGAIAAAVRGGGQSARSGAGLAGATAGTPATAPMTRLRGVVAIGEAAGEVEAAFSAEWPVARASSMGEAVAQAARMAEPGDAVLLSPGCASFDWYGSYEERGADFASAVRALPGATRRS